MTLLHEKATLMLQSPQNVTKATIGYIIWVRGSDVDHYALYKVHIEDVTKSTFMLQRPLLNAKAITAYISWAMGSNVDDDDD